MRIQIQVTPEDINLGVPESGDECPIARALIRAIGHEDVYVDDSIMYWDDEEGCHMSTGTPTIAANFIKNFDAKEPVEPISFEIVADYDCDGDCEAHE